MVIRYDKYWSAWSANSRIRRALVVSLLLHALAVGGWAVFAQRRPPIPIVPYFEVQMAGAGPVGMPMLGPEMAQPPAPAPPPPPPPPPAPPKKEEPKPEPPKPKEEPKPEPPKPKLEPKPKEEPKPEKPKPKEEPKPKQPDKKTEQKPDKKTDAKPAPNQTPQTTTSTTQSNQPAATSPLGDPTVTGVAMGSQFPSELGYWGRRVQVKVSQVWTAPAGMRIIAGQNQAEVGFWVDKRGNLIGEPEVLKEASDPDLAASGVQAIKLCAPFPPLPDAYGESKVQVVYVFTLAS